MEHRCDREATFGLGRDHAHRSVLVTAGSVTIDGHACPVGMHLEVPTGVGLGEIVAGAAGARLHLLADG